MEEILKRAGLELDIYPLTWQRHAGVLGKGSTPLDSHPGDPAVKELKALIRNLVAPLGG